MGCLGLVAHGVSVPIEKHRREEFKRRAIYMSKQFDTIIFSLDRGVKEPFEEEDDYVRVVRLPRSYIKSAVFLKRLARSYDVDVLFCDTLGDAIPASYVSMGRRRPALIVFIQAHEASLNALFLRKRMGIEVKRGLLEVLFWPKDAAIIRLSDKVLCVSKWLMRYARALARGKEVAYIPHSLAYVKDLPRDHTWLKSLLARVASRAGVDEDELKLVCYSGVLSANKRPDIAIRAQALVVKEFPECVLLVAGGGPELRSTIALSRRLGMSSNVMFLGQIPQYRAITLVSGCHVMIHPSLSEGWGLSMGEAMALGCPVVCYASESAIELTRGMGGVLIRSLDPSEYARAICELLSDEKLRTKIIEKASELVKPYLELPEEERFEIICEHIQDYMRGR